MNARILFVTLGFLTLTLNAFAQSNVHGVVRDIGGAPMAHVPVRLFSNDLRQPLTTNTDASGRYEFPEVTPGIRVKIVAIRDLREVAHAYSLVTQRVEVVDLTERIVSYEPTSLAAILAESGPGGEVAGIVNGDGGPLPGVRLTFGDSLLSAVTDAGGRYVFRGLRPGIVAAVHVTASGYRPIDHEVTVVDGQRTAVDFALTTATPTLDSTPVSSGGVLGAQDPLGRNRQLFRAVAWVPALERGNDPVAGSSQSSIAQPVVAPGPPARPSGSIDIDMVGLGGTLYLPLGPRLSATVSTRRSLFADGYDAALNWFGPTSGTPVRDRVARFSGGVFPDAPLGSSFADTSAGFSWAATESDRVSFSLFDWRSDLNNSHDLTTPVASAAIHAVDDNVLPSDAVVQVSDVAKQTSRGFGLMWRHAWASAQRTTISIDRSASDSAESQAWLLDSPTAGDFSFAVARGGSQALSESNRLEKVSVGVAHSVSLGFAHALQVGGDLSSIDVNYSLQTEEMDQGLSTLTSNLRDLVRQAESTTEASVYAQDEWRPTGRLTLAPAVRVRRDQRTASAYVEPSARANYQLLPLIRLRAEWNLQHDIENEVTREDRLHGDGRWWALADGLTIPVVRARDASVGGTVDFPGGTIDVSFYQRSRDNLTLLAPRLYPGVGPSGGLFHHGTGSAKGFVFGLHHGVDRSTLAIEYTVSQATMLFPTLEPDAFPASNDRTHQLRFSEVVVLSPKWTATVSWMFASGQPSTAASGLQQVWFPSGIGVEQVTFASKNGSRLAAYHRLDASTSYVIPIGALRASIGLNVFNLYDRQNVLFEEYETAGQVVTPHDVTAIGRAANAFFRVRF